MTPHNNMSSKTLFIIAIFNMNLRGRLGRGIRLPNGLILTNSQEQVSELLSASFEKLVGIIESETLRRADAAIYCIADQQDPFPENEAKDVLVKRLGEVNLFLLALWLIKDNSVNVELGFIEWPHGHISKLRVTSNARAIRFSRADGSVGHTEFTDTEVRMARDLYSALFAASIVDRNEYLGYVVPEDSGRLTRLFYFIQQARSCSDLGNRIAGYITCFEALFCTDSSEMTHKLSERVAFFLSETPAQRLEMFKTVKMAYNIRSKTVHGDKISKKLAEQAAAISASCDEALRSALYKILTNRDLIDVFSGSPQALEEFLIRLVLDPQSISVTKAMRLTEPSVAHD